MVEAKGRGEDNLGRHVARRERERENFRDMGERQGEDQLLCKTTLIDSETTETSAHSDHKQKVVS